MGRNARAAAEARSWTRIFDDLMDHYSRAAHQGNGDTDRVSLPR